MLAARASFLPTRASFKIVCACLTCFLSADMCSLQDLCTENACSSPLTSIRSVRVCVLLLQSSATRPHAPHCGAARKKYFCRPRRMPLTHHMCTCHTYTALATHTLHVSHIHCTCNTYTALATHTLHLQHIHCTCYAYTALATH